MYKFIKQYNNDTIKTEKGEYDIVFADNIKLSELAFIMKASEDRDSFEPNRYEMVIGMFYAPSRNVEDNAFIESVANDIIIKYETEGKTSISCE